MKTKNLLLTALFFIGAFCAVGQWNDQNSGITNDLEDVFFLDANNGWAVGRQGKIVRTTNGGSTWTSQNSGTTKDLNKVFMVSTSIGYAVGDDGVFIKYNGSNWSTIDISYSQDMFGVYFLDASTGWISGDWGRIMMTTNGGTSWTNQVTNAMYSNCFNDLHMLSSTDGWAVGTSGRVLHYNGTNWQNVTNPASDDLYAVSFSSASNGFMSGQSSSMFYYDGSSWTTFGTDLPDNSFHIYDVCTISSSLAYAATTPGFGGNGIILKYNGSTWAVDYEYSDMGSELFTGVDFPTASKGYVVGAGGMIKSKGSSGSSGIEDQENNLAAALFPNPCANSVTLRLTVSGSDRTTIRLMDVSGKTVQQLMNDQLSGTVEIEVDASTLDAGIYFVAITSGELSQNLRLIKE